MRANSRLLVASLVLVMLLGFGIAASPGWADGDAGAPALGSEPAGPDAAEAPDEAKPPPPEPPKTRGGVRGVPDPDELDLRVPDPDELNRVPDPDDLDLSEP